MKIISEKDLLDFGNEISEEDEENQIKILNLIQGELITGEKAYAYILSSPKEYSQMIIDKKNSDDLAIDNYGEVIFSGNKKEPPEYIVKIIQEKYGGDTEFGEFLDDIVKKL